MPKTYIVEHMEPEIGPWSTLEYITIATETTPPSRFTITSFRSALPAALASTSATATPTDVRSLPDLDPARVMLLDPAATTELTPADGARFEFFVFGGILGDDPPRDRTGELRRHGFVGRRLGAVQMTTDTAVRVTRMVVEGGQTLEEIPFVDFPELRFGRNESTEMPFRYVKGEDGEPVMPDGMRELIRKDADKSLEDLF